MRPVVLVGHRHICPLHGPGTVVSGTSAVTVDGREVACVGDVTSCGAVIVTGALATCAGRKFARKGDKTSHGGTLVEGHDGWVMD
jgi:uncharacterized Zn-binding protein involved in type VI secretion